MKRNTSNAFKTDKHFKKKTSLRYEIDSRELHSINCFNEIMGDVITPFVSNETACYLPI